MKNVLKQTTTDAILGMTATIEQKNILIHFLENMPVAETEAAIVNYVVEQSEGYDLEDEEQREWLKELEHERDTLLNRLASFESMIVELIANGWSLSLIKGSLMDFTPKHENMSELVYPQYYEGERVNGQCTYGQEWMANRVVFMTDLLRAKTNRGYARHCDQTDFGFADELDSNL